MAVGRGDPCSTVSTSGIAERAGAEGAVIAPTRQLGPSTRFVMNDDARKPETDAPLWPERVNR